eukprot:symbB.v1.2.040998.t1/scaffold7723.1/size9711/1
MDGAIEAAERLQSTEAFIDPPPEPMRPWPPSSALIEVLGNIAKGFKDLPEDAEQLCQELEVVLALLDIDMSRSLSPPSSEVEVAAFTAMLTCKRWELTQEDDLMDEQVKASKISKRLEVSWLHFHLRDFTKALEDVTSLVFEDPSNKEALSLLESCEKEVAREVQEKAGFLYSFDWSEGEDGVQHVDTRGQPKDEADICWWRCGE